MKIQNCRVGEIFRSEINRFFIFYYFQKFLYIYIKNYFSCDICKPGTYSLRDSFSASSCLSCTSEFFCPGGSELLLIPGIKFFIKNNVFWITLQAHGGQTYFLIKHTIARITKNFACKKKYSNKKCKLKNKEADLKVNARKDILVLYAEHVSLGCQN